MSLLSVVVCISAFAFKVSFTAADAPELLRGVDMLSPLVALTSSISLVAQARVAFLGIAQLLAYATYCHSPWKQNADKKGMISLGS
jgi:ethanolamine phosphate transferase 2 subunit G